MIYFTDKDKAALTRLVEHAKTDTGQGVKCANFLLAWWNAAENGGFDFTDFWSLDRAIVDDMMTIIYVIALEHCYPDALGFDQDFQKIWEKHRSEKP